MIYKEIIGERYITFPEECPVSPSGKTNFKCRCCGVIAPYANKVCDWCGFTKGHVLEAYKAEYEAGKIEK